MARSAGRKSERVANYLNHAHCRSLNSRQCSAPPLLLAFFVSYFVGSFDILCLRRCREVDLVEAEGEGVVEGVVLGAAICLLWVSRLLISSPCLAREQLCIPYVIS